MKYNLILLKKSGTVITVSNGSITEIAFMSAALINRAAQDLSKERDISFEQAKKVILDVVKKTGIKENTNSKQ